MVKILFFTSIILSIINDLKSQNFDNIKDMRDDKIYKTVKIGNQIWMAENLKAIKFLNGDEIKEARTKKEWIEAIKNKLPIWTYYENDSLNGNKFGILYNWFAVNDPRGLAPFGWHIPSDLEWTELTDHLGGTIVSGKKLRIINNNISTTGFDALMAGSRSEIKSAGMDCLSFWWSSTKTKSNGGWLRKISNSNQYIERLEMFTSLAASVRCIKNDTNHHYINNTAKYYLVSRNLGFQFFDVDYNSVSEYLNEYFAVSSRDIDSLKINLKYLLKYLYENRYGKHNTFELNSGNTKIKVNTIYKYLGNIFQIEIKSTINNLHSDFIISNSNTPAKYSIYYIKRLLDYLNYHIPPESD
jgi:uncharacterized protein (TIGR02145 family)